MRRLFLAAVLLAASACLGLSTSVGYAAPAKASGCATFSAQRLSGPAQLQLNRLTQKVDAVFEGQVELPRKAAGALTVQVHVLAAWTKGVKVPATVPVRLQAGVCRTWTLAHRSPEDYIFLVSVSRRGYVAVGDKPRVLAHTAALEKVLGTPSYQGGSGGDGTSGSAAVAFTPTGLGAPRSFGRLAAPGAAIALIGALGLLAVRRLARR